MKLWLIKKLDWFDDKVLGHRWYWFCCWVAWHSWWGIDWDDRSQWKEINMDDYEMPDEDS